MDYLNIIIPVVLLLLLFFTIFSYAKSNRNKNKTLKRIDMSMLNQVKNISDKDKDILKFVLQGKKILAIKHTRELYGYGLKEAKDYVEELERRWEDSI